MRIGRCCSGCSRISCCGLCSPIRSRLSVFDETNKVVLGIARRRTIGSCLPCDRTCSPRSTVEEERERYEGVVSVPLSKGLFYEQLNEAATTSARVGRVFEARAARYRQLA